MCPYLPLDPFSSRERPRSSKKGAATTPVQTFTFFQLLDSFSSRERPEILQKGALQLDVSVASISASTCFFLWHRESALLLCKRIPLKIVYAWPPSIAPLECQGLNLTSASVMGNWTASIAERLLLIYRWTPFPALSGRDPPKRGLPPHQFRPSPFSSCWTPIAP